MGADAGFDMVPRLSKGAEDKRYWQAFINAIKEYYQDDDHVEVKANYIEFKEGEHPMLPFEGHKFLRFSSKITGSHTGNVEEYIETVRQAAKHVFGARVHAWNELFGHYGFYRWTEVQDSFMTYEKPSEAEVPIAVTQPASSIHSNSGLGWQFYEIHPIPGKGKGIIATADIAKGTRILIEKPLFTAANISPISAMEESVVPKVKALSKSEQRTLLSLHNNFPGKYAFSGIVKTNALPCGAGSLIAGVYSTISRINHSCVRNSHNSWNSATGYETIHALRDIKAGEEITISYDDGQPSAPRRKHLKDAFGFDCTCSLCSLPLPELQASDARRREIEHLDEAIGEPARVMNKPHEALADCQRLLKLAEQEYDGSACSAARVYYDAFQISITHGDQARASVFAKRAYESRLISEGDDSPETQKVKDLMINPAQHRNFGSSKKWKTAKKLVPRGLDSDAFERWLWRQGG